MNTQEIWDSFLQTARTELGDAVCELWFSSMKLTALKDGRATVEVPNHFFKEWVQDNHSQFLPRVLSELTGIPVEVRLHISDKEDKDLRKSDEKIERRQQSLAKKGIFLNPKYTFANFVRGASNEFARGASLKAAEAPGRVYNPLFIYGGVGLGKTHLITAIGNKILAKHPSYRVHYVPVEQFTNEVVSAIRHARTEELKEKYRELDVLLIDDVQMLEGKQATENELFHTFNVLYESQKQIVISSDRPPVEITSITDRLRSRFGMGLVADIQPPGDGDEARDHSKARRGRPPAPARRGRLLHRLADKEQRPRPRGLHHPAGGLFVAERPRDRFTYRKDRVKGYNQGRRPAAHGRGGRKGSGRVLRREARGHQGQEADARHSAAEAGRDVPQRASSPGPRLARSARRSGARTTPP